MRPLLIQVEKGKGNEIIELVKKYDGRNFYLTHGKTDDKDKDIITAYFSNRNIGKVVGELENIDNLHYTIYPFGALALPPHNEQIPEQLKDVEPLSPIEIILSGLQSIGSWRGFMGYSIIGGIVVWIALYVNIIYLLVGAMLIAPFAGPAMVSAMGTALGDWHLIKRGMIRYFVAIIITIAVCILLSLIMQQQYPSPLMIDMSKISRVSVLMALAAGAAGAFNLVQSENDSLVSGAATGMLVAASLAPPTGVIGMAVAIGEWQLAKSGVFLLILQLVGINLSGSLIFRWYKVNTKGLKYREGKARVYLVSLAVSIISITALLMWQFDNSPKLERSSIAQRANTEVQKIFEQNEELKLLESNVRFTKPAKKGSDILLCTVYALSKKPLNSNEKELKRKDFQRAINKKLKDQFPNFTSLSDIIIVVDTQAEFNDR